MTWKQFKDLLEQAGVTDEMEISYIDVTAPACPEDLIVRVPGPMTPGVQVES